MTIKAKPVLLIDMDGVIANYSQAFLDKWRELYPDREYIPLSKLTEFYIEELYPTEYKYDIRNITRGEGFFETIPPIPGAIESLKSIMEKGEFEPFLCTAPDLDCPTQSCASEKTRWVDKYLGREWTERLVITKDKTLVYGKYLIDDKPIIKGIQKPAWSRIIFNQPYNQYTPGMMLEGWDKWEEFSKLLLAYDNSLPIPTGLNHRM